MDTSERKRLNTNRDRVLDLMRDGDWHTSVEIMAVGGMRGVGRLNELKDLGYDYEKRKKTAGVWEFRLFRPAVHAQQAPLFDVAGRG